MQISEKSTKTQKKRRINITFAERMEYNTATLSNGLRIIHLPSPSKVVYCGYMIAAGSRHEQVGEEGLAHFCEHMTFKGTRSRRACNILNRLESVGGDLNAFTNKEETAFHCAVTAEHLPRAIDLLSDIVFHSTYPDSEIEKEVEVICDEIESYNDSPSELIYDEFENILFCGHPLGHNILGSPDRVRRFTSDDAVAFTRRHYRPENAIFFASGDICFSRLVHLIEKALSDFSSALPLKKRNAATLPPLSKGEIVAQRDTHQAHVMIGQRALCAYDKHRYTLSLLNNIVGGTGMNARLNIILRERRGLVYSVESSAVSYDDTGLWAVYFGCDHKDVRRCLRLVDNELRRYIERPLSNHVLASAKKQLKGQIGIACDNRESFTLDFAKSFLHYDRERDLAEIFSRIDNVTADDMQQLAQQIFALDNLTTLIFGRNQ